MRVDTETSVAANQRKKGTGYDVEAFNLGGCFRGSSLISAMNLGLTSLDDGQSNCTMSSLIRSTPMPCVRNCFTEWPVPCLAISTNTSSGLSLETPALGTRLFKEGAEVLCARRFGKGNFRRLVKAGRHLRLPNGRLFGVDYIDTLQSLKKIRTLLVWGPQWRSGIPIFPRTGGFGGGLSQEPHDVSKKDLPIWIAAKYAADTKVPSQLLLGQIP